MDKSIISDSPPSKFIPSDNNLRVSPMSSHVVNYRICANSRREGLTYYKIKGIYSTRSDRALHAIIPM